MGDEKKKPKKSFGEQNQQTKKKKIFSRFFLEEVLTCNDFSVKVTFGEKSQRKIAQNK